MEDTSVALFNNVDGYVPTLVGNYVEHESMQERALAQRTGAHRFRPHNPAGEEQPTTVYGKSSCNTEQARPDTLPRTIEHDEQYVCFQNQLSNVHVGQVGIRVTLSAEWLPTSRVVYQPPDQRVGDLIKLKAANTVGRREAQELAALMEEAKQRAQPQQALPEGAMKTTYQEKFVQHDLTGLELGARQMKTQDGLQPHRDPDFLAETKCLSRDMADRYVRAPGSLNQSQRTAVVPGDEPVTIYSEALAKGQYAGTMYGTGPFGACTFGKMTNFTKQVGDYTKDPSDE